MTLGLEGLQLDERIRKAFGLARAYTYIAAFGLGRVGFVLLGKRKSKKYP
jgi:hypothetical protein